MAAPAYRLRIDDQAMEKLISGEYQEVLGYYSHFSYSVVYKSILWGMVAK